MSKTAKRYNEDFKRTLVYFITTEKHKLH